MKYIHANTINSKAKQEEIISNVHNLAVFILCHKSNFYHLILHDEKARENMVIVSKGIFMSKWQIWWRVCEDTANSTLENHPTLLKTSTNSMKVHD